MSRHRLEITLIGAALAFVAACGSAAKPATFHPAGPAPAAAASPASAPSARGALTRPPFGQNVRVEMSGWLPAGSRRARAVVADKDFELAYLYAEYTGGKDTRWTAYVSHAVLRDFAADLAKPDVTTESFRGTVSYTHMRAFADPAHKGAIDVSGCYDNARSANTSITTGKVIPDRTPADDHYFRYTDILAKGGTGNWRVIGNYPAVYYPQARECKP
jgi:hypothetical protein